MTDIILTFKGTLDKYIGDAVMCFWGAPLLRKTTRSSPVNAPFASRWRSRS
jgi:class 3 adenylate cyclase